MAKVGVQRATELTGKSKSTIQRAMKSGKISFDVENNRKLIDVSELERVFGVETTALSSDNAANINTAPAYEVELQKARHALEIDRLELKVKMLEEQIDSRDQQIEDLKAQRDSWQKQAQQVLLTSQHSQEQADARIAELQKREEERQKAMQMKRQQQMQRQKQIQASNQNTSQKNSLFTALFTKQKKAS